MKPQNKTFDDSSQDVKGFNGWFRAVITAYVIIEAACIALLMYLWFSN